MALTACVVARGRGHQVELGGAFAEGLRRHGLRVEIGSKPRPADILVLWGVRDQAAIKRHPGEVVILERGYIGDRFTWTSVSFGGGLNGRAEFRGVSSDGTRFDRHHRMEAWRKPGGYALLVGQVPGDMSLVGAGGRLDGWLRGARDSLQGWRVVYRPHPMAVQRGLSGPDLGVETHRGALADALAGAGLCVTWNSNTAVDAVLAGVPSVAMDAGSMAWPVTAHDLGIPPIRPRRDEWAARLAWCQWLPDEMRSGECWARIGGGIA